MNATNHPDQVPDAASNTPNDNTGIPARSESLLPSEFVDSHHHFVDTSNNSFQSFLKTFIGSQSCGAAEYEADVRDSLASAGVKLLGSVHVEAMPDDGAKEVAWIEGLINAGRCHTIKAIVASADLASENISNDLQALKRASPSNLRGVRWILDCVGPYGDGDTATHCATLRHDGVDFLRGSDGGYEGTTIPAFERGYALLADHGLSFDLQCAPSQLKAASVLCGRHPNIPVCIDHIGKPRCVLGPDDPNNTNTVPNHKELDVWREGMKAMATLPHAYVKISMLGYAVPGWIRNESRTAVLRDLVRETVTLFGPRRCMVALNWWKDAPCSDSDGLSDVGPSPVQFCEKIHSFFEGYSDEDKQRMFVGTARDFYHF